MKRYILEKKCDDEWYYEGTYTEECFDNLLQRIFWLGRYGSVYDDIRIRTEEE